MPDYLRRIRPVKPDTKTPLRKMETEAIEQLEADGYKPRQDCQRDRQHCDEFKG